MVDQPDDIASDIVQKTLVSGFQKLNRCRDPFLNGSVAGSSGSLIANLCKDFLKSPRRADLSGLFRPRGSVGKAGIGPREAKGVDAGLGPGTRGVEGAG